MGGDVSEERKREMKERFDGRAALQEQFGFRRSNQRHLECMEGNDA